MIWDFMMRKDIEAVHLEYLGSTIDKATEHCVTLDCEVYFDIGLEKAVVLECWYENGNEYVFGIKEY